MAQSEGRVSSKYSDHQRPPDPLSGTTFCDLAIPLHGYNTPCDGRLGLYIAKDPIDSKSQVRFSDRRAFEQGRSL